MQEAYRRCVVSARSAALFPGGGGGGVSPIQSQHDCTSSSPDGGTPSRPNQGVPHPVLVGYSDQLDWDTLLVARWGTHPPSAGWGYPPWPDWVTPLTRFGNPPPPSSRDVDRQTPVKTVPFPFLRKAGGNDSFVKAVHCKHFMASEASWQTSVLSYHCLYMNLHCWQYVPDQPAWQLHRRSCPLQGLS